MLCVSPKWTMASREMHLFCSLQVPTRWNFGALFSSAAIVWDLHVRYYSDCHVGKHGKAAYCIHLHTMQEHGTKSNTICKWGGCNFFQFLAAIDEQFPHWINMAHYKLETLNTSTKQVTVDAADTGFSWSYPKDLPESPNARNDVWGLRKAQGVSTGEHRPNWHDSKYVKNELGYWNSSKVMYTLRLLKCCQTKPTSTSTQQVMYALSNDCGATGPGVTKVKRLS